MLTLICILINVNSIVYPCKICHEKINNKDYAAQCDICHMKCNKLNHIDTLTTNISKAQMILGTVFLVAVTFFPLGH